MRQRCSNRSDPTMLCTVGTRCRAFSMRCAWWTSWTRAMRLICPWWSAPTWEWRWPSCTAGLWRITASVCSWMQTPWWENTEQIFLFDSLESQNFAKNIHLKMSRFYQTSMSSLRGRSCLRHQTRVGPTASTRGFLSSDRRTKRTRSCWSSAVKRAASMVRLWWPFLWVPYHEKKGTKFWNARFRI